MKGIDYNKISDGINFYQKRNFEYIEVPWIVSKEADEITSPTEVRFFANFLGHNVASGEQSFLKLILDNKLSSGKYVCCTPCFRDEKNLDEIHHNWFMKVELIDFLGYSKISEDEKQERLNYVINSSYDFFNRYLDVEIIDTLQGKDIISKESQIELGSCGVRSHNNFSWIYGTGIAEPRLSFVLDKIPRGYHLLDIPRGENGFSSKILEEFLEFNDSLNQGNKIMSLLELSDLVGSIELYLAKNHSSIQIDDLLKMKDVTTRVFLNGKR